MSSEKDCCTPRESKEQINGSRKASDFMRHLTSDRRVLMIGGMVVVAGALALNWGWLTAIGAASIILAVAPCGVMCALGLCMSMRGHPNSTTDKLAAGTDTKTLELKPNRPDVIPSRGAVPLLRREQPFSTQRD